MSFRFKVPLALSLVALLAAGCTEVEQEADPESFLVATFDPGQPGVRAATIPLPNDLALQAAPSVPPGQTRSALFTFIDAGGYLTDAHPVPTGFEALRQASIVSIPLRLMARQADGSYAVSTGPAPTLDAASITGGTVAIVRVSGEGAPQAYAPVVVQNVSGVVRLVPEGGYVPGTRYVVALRGGEAGVRAGGLVVGAEAPIALIAPNIDLSVKENQPIGGLSPAQALQLEQIRGLYGARIDWNRIPPSGAPTAASEAFCRAALGIPSSTPFPEGRCWLPTAGQGNTPVISAFDAIDLVFPRTEAASIQVFEIAPAAG